MKKIICILICLLMVMSSVCVIASATSNNVVEYIKDDTKYTVEFEDSTVSEEKKVVIANALIGTDEAEIMTANIWCDLFGHDYKYTTASVVQHKAKIYAPRCKKQSYDVTYCEDCDYTEQTLKSVVYIECCPED